MVNTMNRLARIFSLTFTESFSANLTQRAVFFYTLGILGYSVRQNLLLALGTALVYVTFTRLSHRLTGAWGERRVLRSALGVLLVSHLGMLARPQGATLVLFLLGTAMGHAFKWPVIESYVSAGRSRRASSAAIGRFNLTWALASPIALILAGPLIAFSPRLLFLAAASGNLLSLLLTNGLAARPMHLAPNDPERPGESEFEGFRRLLASARWMLMLNYALLFLLSPLIPEVFKRLGTPVVIATGLTALLDLARAGAFAVMTRTMRWHGRKDILLACLPVLIGSFLLILFGPNLAGVLAAEVLFGAASGLCYFAALYYAMLSGNASVDASGAHEGVIGLGLALGPVIGLAAQAMNGALGPLGAMLASLSPLAVWCSYRAVRALAGGQTYDEIKE